MEIAAEEEEEEEEEGAVDRFSKLPEHIIHHIMTSLSRTKDVASLSGVSNAFWNAWKSFPIIDFDDTMWRDRKEEFSDCVRQSKKLRQTNNSIEKFRLHAERDESVASDLVDELISFAIDNRVRELELHLVADYLYSFPPQKIVSAKSVITLKLQSISIAGIDFFQYCPLLENLSLVDCSGLKQVQSSSNSLRRINLFHCNQLEVVEISSPNLISFRCHVSSAHCRIRLDAKDLKDLGLGGESITNELFQENVSKFPGLESLELDGCEHVTKVDIHHDGLKSFKLRDCRRLAEVKIENRRLQFFEYDGAVIPFELRTDSALLGARLSIKWGGRAGEWFDGLRKLLGFFGHCRALTVCCEQYQSLLFPEDLRSGLLRTLYDLKSIRIQLPSLPEDYMELVDSLLWLLPKPDTIVLDLRYREVCFKFQYRKTKKELECCSHIKCWRHSLKTVHVVNSEGANRDEIRRYFQEQTPGEIELIF